MIASRNLTCFSLLGFCAHMRMRMSIRIAPTP